MKTLSLIVLCFLSSVIFSQSKFDTIFLSKSKNNKVYLDKDYKKFEHHNIDTTSNIYLPLYLYKNKYYLYKPCDGYHDKSILIKEKSASINIGEDQYFNISNKIKNNRKTSYLLISQNINTELEIKKINKKMYVIRFDNNYYLMTNSNQIKKFPIIINDCPNEKVDEFIFDNIDAKSIFESTN